MHKRLFVLGSVLGCGLLLCVGTVRAQCSGYSSNGPTATELTPDKVAAQGGMTATLYLSRSDNSDASGNMHAGAGSWIRYHWIVNNAASAKLYYAWDSSTTWTDWVDLGTNFNSSGDLNGVQSAGHVLRIKLAATQGAQTTQDVVNLTITSDSAGVITEDYVSTNFYLQMGSSFQGPSMANACTLCQNQPYKCINKMHHPKQHWQVTNNTSGEYHDDGWVYGPAACETCSVSYSGSSQFLSFRPNDSISYNVENEVICDEFGIIYDNQGGDTFLMQTEYAFTTSQTIGSMCQLVNEGNGRTGIECPLAYFCKAGSAPPDFDPAYIFSDQFCAGGIGTCNDNDIPVFPPFWLIGGGGFRFKAFGNWSQWIWPTYDLQGAVLGLRSKSAFINFILDIANLAIPNPTNATPISCTNADKGTGPLPPIGWPFPIWP